MLDEKNKELQAQALKVLEEGEDKSKAIVEAMELIATSQNEAIIQEVLAESNRAKNDHEYASKIGLRTLSKKETAFYEALKNPEQSIVATQSDIFPETLIDNTLEDVKKDSNLLSLINFAPANVKKWLVAEKSGSAVWGPLTEALKSELTATFKTLNIELSKLHVFMIIPKAIRELSLPFVDRYFMAILKEAMNDGAEAGFLNGNGKDAPIGIYNKILDSTNGVHKPKAMLTTITGFSPKQLAPVLKTLSNNGKRIVGELYLICNPLDRYEYINPSLYGETLGAGYIQKSFMPIEIIESINAPVGKAAFTLKGKYTMGFSGLKIDEYKETKALDDADLLVAKIYANGIATDDNTAVVFDVTKLEEYIQTVKSIAPTV